MVCLVSYLSPLKSELKLDILLSLLKSEKKLSELEKELQTRETTILHALKDLEQLEFTTKSRGAYKLTQLGVIEAQICKGCCLSFEVLKKHKNFWLTHDISIIPPALMRNLGAIEHLDIVKSTDVDLQKVHENFIRILLSSKTIFGVSPIFHPDYIAAFREILDQGGKISLIVNNAVLEKIKQEPTDQLYKYISNGSLQIFLNENLKFALTVTDTCWSLGLFNLSGEYDYSTDLICCGEDGLDWGHQLFRKTLEQSTKV
jgi:predicted transcriptional regulator